MPRQIQRIQKVTEKGITEILKIALTQLARANTYESLKKMRGKVQFSIDVKDLRKDR